MAFNCLPSDLRSENIDELELVGEAVNGLRLQENPAVLMFGKK